MQWNNTGFPEVDRLGPRTWPLTMVTRSGLPLTMVTRSGMVTAYLCEPVMECSLPSTHYLSSSNDSNVQGPLAALSQYLGPDLGFVGPEAYAVWDERVFLNQIQL